MSQFKLLLLCTLSCAFLLTSTILQGQSSVHPNRYLIVFDASATQAEIDDVMHELNSEEIWVSPISKTRLWEAEFPYTPPQGLPILDINSQVPHAQSRPKVNEVGFDYDTEDGEGYLGKPESAIPCYEHQALQHGQGSVSLSIFDTGINVGAKPIPGFYFEIGPFSEYDYINDDHIANDDNGHGNHIRSIAAHMINKVSAVNGTTPPEVDYNIDKTFDDAGNGYLAEIILAFENAVVDGAQIANFSWSVNIRSIDAYNSPLYTSLQLCAAEYGVLIVCAAGNNTSDLDNMPYPNFPAAYHLDHILTVTSHDCHDDLTSFANYGLQSVDIAVDGQLIYGLNQSGTGITRKSGTSQSTAIISGVAASLATHQTTFNALDIKCAIIESAELIPKIRTQIVSDGILDAHKALTILGNCRSLKGGGGPIGGGFGQGRVSPLSPNPAIDHIQLDFSSEANYHGEISIFSVSGKLLNKETITIHKGINTLKMDVSQLNGGLYHLLLDKNGERENHTFVKL